jgi:integrase
MWIRDDHLPLPTVSRLLGHASVNTTQATYVHLTAQDLRVALEEKGGRE